jgi:flagellar M-ring protein FliF
MQRTVESLLEQVLGPNKSAVRVNLELSFDQRTVDKQTFEPVVDDKGILRSTQESSESFKGTNAPSTGAPGTTSNIPGYVTGNTTGGGSTFEKKDVTRNYEVNETKEKVIVSPGGVKKISVAVLVDASVNRAQMDTITKTVASAVGINPTRGDSLSVETIAFNTEVADRFKKEEEQFAQEQQRTQWLKMGLGAAGVGIALFMIYVVLKRRQEEEVELVSGGPLSLDEAIAEISEATPAEKQRSAQYDDIEKLAKARPEDVAQLLKTWLTED